MPVRFESGFEIGQNFDFGLLHYCLSRMFTINGNFSFTLEFHSGKMGDFIRNYFVFRTIFYFCGGNLSTILFVLCYKNSGLSGFSNFH